MKNLITTLVLTLMLMPTVASALTFEKPERELTPAELKLGSIYRGCIGFHCLEEASFLEISLDASCASDEACLTVSTNAREGVVVLMTPLVPIRTCLEEVSGGMEGLEVFQKGCADILGQTSIMRTLDQVEAAFGRLKLAGASGEIRIMSVIAY